MLGEASGSRSRRRSGSPPPQTHGTHSESGQEQHVVNDVDSNLSPVYDDSPDEGGNPGVMDQLKHAALESAELIIGFDFTKSNEWRGARSFHGKSLHCIGAEQNPYEQAVSIIGKTFSCFNKDRMIPCLGFGDASTDDQEVFRFYPDDGVCCSGFEEVIKRYRELVPHLQLGGPKSFASIIEMAISIVKQSRGQYHVLAILADGEVTRGEDTAPGQLSPLERKTADAIMKASEYPLSIVVVGVGDGPWNMMKKFELLIPPLAFDHCRFVNVADILSKNMDSSRNAAEFASAAFPQSSSFYKKIQKLAILCATVTENEEPRISLPPPRCSSGSVGSEGAPHVSDNHFCPICRDKERNMAFHCGHRVCCDCAAQLHVCPFCRRTIDHKIKLLVDKSDNHLCPSCQTAQKDVALCCGHQICSVCALVNEECPICVCTINLRVVLF